MSVGDNRKTFFRPFLPATPKPDQVGIAPIFDLIYRVTAPETAYTIAVEQDFRGFIRRNLLEVFRFYPGVQDVYRTFDMTFLKF